MYLRADRFLQLVQTAYELKTAVLRLAFAAAGAHAHEVVEGGTTAVVPPVPIRSSVAHCFRLIHCAFEASVAGGHGNAPVPV